jgi:hypothetical protein
VYAYLRKDGTPYYMGKGHKIDNKIPISEWEFVTVRSKESKNRL